MASDDIVVYVLFVSRNRVGVQVLLLVLLCSDEIKIEMDFGLDPGLSGDWRRALK